MNPLDRKPLQRPKIVYFASTLEYPPAGGVPIRVMNTIKVLNRISELHIVTPVPPDQLGSAEAPRVLAQLCSALVHAPSSRLVPTQPQLQRIARVARRLAAPLVAKMDVDFLDRYADEHGIDIFWMEGILNTSFHVLKQLRRKRPQARIVADTEAIWSRFILRELPMVSSPLARLLITMRGRKKESWERQLTVLADVVTAVSDVDADYFRSIAADKSRIKRFSNVVDIEDYAKPLQSPPPIKRPCLLLLGSFGHPSSPMDRAAVWTAREIMPLVWQKRPDAHLYIIGRNADLTQSSLTGDRTTVIGRVPSVLGHLKQAAATLVTLRHESGTRFKILESGAASIPCVSTTLGAEGLDVEHGKNILIADTPKEIAAAIVDVLSKPDLAAMLGRNLYTLIAEKYGLDALRREGEDVIRHCMREDRPGATAKRSGDRALVAAAH